MTLTDILGSEDAFGDMDFKVAGTADAVTALQLDTKIDGLPADVLAKALLQAKEARLTILGVMAGAIAEPRDHVADSAPKIVSMEIPIDKIGEVIGPKGKVINTLQQETGADIAVDDDGVVGTVTIGAKDGNAVEEARRRISLILDPPTAEVGAVYAGQGGQHHQVRRLRQRAARAATACCTSRSCRRWPAASASTTSRTCSRSASRSRSGSTTSTRRARCRCRWPSAPEGRAAVVGQRSSATVTPAVRSSASSSVGLGGASSSAAAPAKADGSSFEDAFEAELVADLGDLGPGAADAGSDRGDRGDRGGDRRPSRGRSRRR